MTKYHNDVTYYTRFLSTLFKKDIKLHKIRRVYLNIPKKKSWNLRLFRRLSFLLVLHITVQVEIFFFYTKYTDVKWHRTFLEVTGKFECYYVSDSKASPVRIDRGSSTAFLPFLISFFMQCSNVHMSRHRCLASCNVLMCMCPGTGVFLWWMIKLQIWLRGS